MNFLEENTSQNQFLPTYLRHKIKNLKQSASGSFQVGVHLYSGHSQIACVAGVKWELGGGGSGRGRIVSVR